MKRLVALSTLAAIVLTATWFIGCASEPAKTKALYTDAKKMYDEIERAFTLSAGNERAKLMKQILADKWDLQVVEKLRKYLADAPKGSYAKEATELLDKAIKSQHLRMLGQARPLLEQYGQGIPETQAEADSVTKHIIQQQKADTTHKVGGQ